MEAWQIMWEASIEGKYLRTVLVITNRDRVQNTGCGSRNRNHREKAAEMLWTSDENKSRKIWKKNLSIEKMNHYNQKFS